MKKEQKVISVDLPNAVNDYISQGWTVVQMTTQAISTGGQTYGTPNGKMWLPCF